LHYPAIENTTAADREITETFYAIETKYNFTFNPTELGEIAFEQLKHETAAAQGGGYLTELEQFWQLMDIDELKLVRKRPHVTRLLLHMFRFSA
jgi:hypothetical protein